ncbi:MAG: hypothetical protein ABI779_06215 [Acidobacteriota bacterium]
MLLNVVIPLLPIILELIFYRGVKTSTLLITAFVYLVTVAGISQSVFMTVSFFAISGLFGVLYGSWISASHPFPDGEFWIRLSVWAALGLAFVTQALDRWKVHVENNVPCFAFQEGK